MDSQKIGPLFRHIIVLYILAIIGNFFKFDMVRFWHHQIAILRSVVCLDLFKISEMDYKRYSKVSYCNLLWNQIC